MNSFMSMPFGFNPNNQNNSNNVNIQNKIYDPAQLDNRKKKGLISDNIRQSVVGLYQMFPKFRPVTCSFVTNFNPGLPSNICEINVVNLHSIDAAENFTEKGINFTPTNNMNPAILNVVGKDFTGTNFEMNEDIRDEMINLRTSFNNTIGTHNPYPLKETDCVYSTFVGVIRPKNLNGFLPYPQIFRFSMITTSPLKKPKMLDDNRMCTTDFIKTCSTIECVFQAAISAGHPILILTPFGHDEDENPVDDIIKIYNYCIFKYGHRFRQIIVAIPPFYPKKIFENYDKNIVRLQNLVAEVDAKYDTLEMKKKLHNKITTPDINNDAQKSLHDSSTKSNELNNVNNTNDTNDTNNVNMQNMLTMMQNMMKKYNQTQGQT